MRRLATCCLWFCFTPCSPPEPRLRSLTTNLSFTVFLLFSSWWFSLKVPAGGSVNESVALQTSSVNNGVRWWQPEETDELTSAIDLSEFVWEKLILFLAVNGLKYVWFFFPGDTHVRANQLPGGASSLAHEPEWKQKARLRFFFYT